MSESSITNFKHIRIVPSTWPCILLESNLLFKITNESWPVIGDFESSSPGVTDFGPPLPDFLLSPIANWEENWSFCFIQCLGHRRVSFDGWDVGRKAIIVFQVINPKNGKNDTSTWHRFEHQFFRSCNCQVFLDKFWCQHRCKFQTWVLCYEHIKKEIRFQMGIFSNLQLWLQYCCLCETANNHQDSSSCNQVDQGQESRFYLQFPW